jgi:predicted O-methyltransferase YrrM
MSSSEPETAASLYAASADAYVRGRFATEDRAARRIREGAETAGLPTVQLPAVTARTLQLLLRMVGARRVVEVGTLAGYSALWIARALLARSCESDGLLTIEIDPARAALARRNLDEAGVGDLVEVRVGSGREVLAELGPDASLDALFLDADKEGLPDYILEARRLLRPGGLLLVDNALWRGQVMDPGVDDDATEAIRRSHDLVRNDPAFDATILPVGDGLLVALRR